MSRSCKQNVALMVLAAAAILWSVPACLAKPPGGGGGGSPAYNIISFEPYAPSNSSFISDINGLGTAAVGSAELTSGETRWAHFDINTQTYTTFPLGVALSGMHHWWMGGTRCLLPRIPPSSQLLGRFLGPGTIDSLLGRCWIDAAGGVRPTTTTSDKL